MNHYISTFTTRRNQWLLLIGAFSVCLSSVYADVSEINGIKTFPSTTASSNAENSNSFSILTKEFLNKPDVDDGKTRSDKPPNNVRNLAPFPTIRVNGLEANNIAETDDSDERQPYFYDKPKIPFESEDRESTNIHTNTVPPKNDETEDFGGYQYPKPAIPFPPPTTTTNPDAESVPARLVAG